MPEIAAWVAPEVWAYPVGVALLAYVVLGAVGFGSALILVPLLAWRYPLPLVVSVALMLDIISSAFHAYLNRHEVLWRHIPKILPASVAGAALGILVLWWTRANALLVVLGLYITWVAWRQATGRKESMQFIGRSTAMSGILVGMVQVLFGTAGPLVLLWLGQRGASPRELRATVPAAMVVFALIALSMMLASAQVQTAQLFTFFGHLLPISLFGVWAGHRLSHHVPAGVMKRSIEALLLVSGVSLTLKGLFSTGLL